MRFHGAENRGRTDTMFPSRDFKSLASAYSAIPAGLCVCSGCIIAQPFEFVNKITGVIWCHIPMILFYHKRCIFVNIASAVQIMKRSTFNYYVPIGTLHSLWRFHSSLIADVLHFQKESTPFSEVLSFWRHHPDLNWGWGFCRPLPYHLAMMPYIIFFLERETGFGPATFTLARWHSTTESLPQNWLP